MNDNGGEITADQIFVARGWLAVADRDVRSAYACLDAHAPIPETAAYHCQQAAEKLMKGLLVLAQVPFRKTHDLEALRDLVVARFPDFTTAVDRLVPLTDWGHVFRYPDLGDEPVPSVDMLRSVLAEIAALTAAIRSRPELAPAPEGIDDACHP
jgi:HEPN domain-containing protein